MPESRTQAAGVLCLVARAPQHAGKQHLLHLSVTLEKLIQAFIYTAMNK